MNRVFKSLVYKFTGVPTTESAAIVELFRILQGPWHKELWPHHSDRSLPGFFRILLTRASASVEDILKYYPKAVDATLEDGSTPLHVAARVQNSQAVGLLLRNGADPTKKDKAGKKPRAYAVQCKGSSFVWTIDSRISVDRLEDAERSWCEKKPNQVTGANHGQR